MDEYSIQVSSREQEPQVISGDAINYRYQSEGEVLAHLKEQKPYEWILGYIEPKTFSVKETVTYDKNLLKTEIQNLECAKAENQVLPEDAYVMYEDNNFSIIPETEGTTLNIKQAYLALEAAVSEGESAVDFNASPEAYEEAKVKQDDPGLQSTLDACNNFAKASITYDMGRESVTLDGSTIKDWLLFDDNNQLIQDQKVFEDHIGAFVDELKKKYDTVGTDRELIATTGRLVTVHGNYYGWSIDRAAEVAQLAEDIRNGVVTTREPIYARRGHERNERNDFGDTYIEVDLAYQHMYYYSDGEIIFESDIVSGNPNLEGRATPPGIFSLDFKKTDEILRGQQDAEGKYEYETHVDYWMPFNGGVGFHDAPWQPWFGGDLFLWNGSHGCINLPPEAAARLYDIIDYGVPIIVFN
ncbi:MAG: peptidoglycan binding domain-containing protein [Clostridiales bacterium]|nr:peptidoglycan binding domain-containing protein [Candidatus Blautia equi]